MGERILVKAYDKLGNCIGCGYANSQEDLANLKAYLNEKGAQNNLVIEKEVVRNPLPEDEKELDDFLTAVGNNVKAVETRRELENIYELYDNENITVTEAINRINALYEDEGCRAEAIRDLLNNERSCEYGEDEEYEDCDDCDEYEDDEPEEDCGCGCDGRCDC